MSKKAVSGCRILDGLKWRKKRLSAPWGRVDDTYASVSAKKAREVVEAFLGYSPRLPRPGRALILGECGEAIVELHNDAGKYRVRKA